MASAPRAVSGMSQEPGLGEEQASPTGRQVARCWESMAKVSEAQAPSLKPHAQESGKTRVRIWARCLRDRFQIFPLKNVVWHQTRSLADRQSCGSAAVLGEPSQG